MYLDFRYSAMNNTRTAPSINKSSSVKLDIIQKLNKLLVKQKHLKQEYIKTQQAKTRKKEHSLDHIHLEEGPIHDISNDNSEHDIEKVEKPFFGNYDIVELESQTKVNRSRRKNRQGKDDFIGDDFAALPDQSQSETITQHTVHKLLANMHNFHFQPASHSSSSHGNYKTSNDIRLEIPISLDATISLPKNKESLEELLDFVVKHDANLLEDYLKQKHFVNHNPKLDISPHNKNYHHPDDINHHNLLDIFTNPKPHHEHTTIPDLTHNSYAAVLEPSKDYGVPVKLTPVHEESNHYFM